MEFSDDWRAIFPVASVFFPPNHLQSEPQQFIPQSPPLTLFSAPSLLPHLPPSIPPYLHLHSLQSFLTSQTPHPTSLFPSISPLSPSPPFSSTNLLLSLPSHRPNTLHLFFPTGENSDSIAFLSISLPSSSPPPELTLSQTGDVFIQSEGLKHPSHRILSLSAVPCPNPSLPGNCVSEGFLLVTTLYSVNWFRVEIKVIRSKSNTKRPTRVTESDKHRPVLCPLANHEFENPVIHACFSHHFSEESAVLLESGDLYWFNLKSKQSGKIRVKFNDENASIQWLSCEFGAQPWMVIVASSKGVILVDLRDEEEEQKRNLCRIDTLGLYDVNPIVEKEKILAFCKSSYDNFHFSVLTDFQLMLFDTRRELGPVLTWDHGMENPNYISMFELNQLGNFKKGFAILAGSFCTGQFNLFSYGSKGELEASSTSLHAWGLPFSISLSGRSRGTGEQVMDNLFSKEGVFVKDCNWIGKNEKVVGFCVMPKDLSLTEPGLNGFTLIRLMSLGRLELQNYHASIPNEKTCSQNCILKPCDIITVCPNCARAELPSRRYFLDLKYLNAYLNGNLSETIAASNYQLKEIPPSENLSELINESINYTQSLSPFINNASIPTNISEIAFKSALNNLKPDLMPLAFGKYSDVFVSNRDTSFQLLEVSRRPSERGPLFLLKPFRRGQKWSVKTEAPKESLVGPILPVPVLLSLEERERNGKDSILDLICVEIMEIVSPSISIAETEDPSENNNKSFIIYEPECSNSKMGCRNEKYETFICGVNSGREEINGFKPKTELGVIQSEFFDLGEIKLDFVSREIEVQLSEKEALNKLKNQFSNWLGEYKPYQDFCINSRIPKCMPN